MTQMGLSRKGSSTNFIVFSALLVGVFFLRQPAKSQIQEVLFPISSAEKIYLQLDGLVYTNDNSIWFKAIVTNSIDLTPTARSGVLYAELIGPDQKVLDKKIIKIDQGVGSGFFELSEMYPEGSYLVRAYTEWNKNFGQDFFFSQYIQVFDSSTGDVLQPIENISLIENQDKTKRLEALLQPYTIDSLHKGELSVTISTSVDEEDLSIKESKDGQYKLVYDLDEDLSIVTINIRTGNRSSYFKTIALDKHHIDLQFLPEGGELVHGMNSRVAFKALDAAGKGVKVRGEILDNEGSVVTKFDSNTLGMGSFMLFGLDSTDSFTASIYPKVDGDSDHVFQLPKVAPIGNMLSASKNGDNLNIAAYSNYLNEDSLKILVSCRGKDYYEMKGKLNKGTLMISIPLSKLPEGVVVFKLLDWANKPLSRRLYFNGRPKERLKIEIDTEQVDVLQREQTHIKIRSKNSEGEPVQANFSVLVINRDQMGYLQDTRQNILSQLLLSSDLKGEIEDPGSYFDIKKSARQRAYDLDLLMLTQGWSKYLYLRQDLEIVHKPEPQLTVRGYVNEDSKNPKKKISELTLMTFGQFPTAQSQITDSLGRFDFMIDDEYGKEVGLLIQSAEVDGEKKNYDVSLDAKESPPVAFNYQRSLQSVDTVIQYLLEKNIERKQVEAAFRLSSDIFLDEVVIEDYMITPEREEVTERFGEPDDVISGQAIRDEEEDWSYGLYSVLLFKFPDKVRITKTNNFLYAHCLNPEVTLVVIDGVPVAPEDYVHIPDIDPADVRSFEIIEYAERFRDLYMQVFFTVPPFEVPTLGNVIAIYTFAGKGLHGVSKNIGIQKKSVPVFSVPREFYQPKYPTLSPNDWIKPDLRALIHWEPEISSDSLGHANTSYYNSDNIGEVQVVVEAISPTGEIGYKDFFYNVKRRRR